MTLFLYVPGALLEQVRWVRLHPLNYTSGCAAPVLRADNLPKNVLLDQETPTFLMHRYQIPFASDGFCNLQ